ncbi:trypsin-like peptidase domain-containing protein [archaeon]|nr:trypsin-like peptidase domain-containing protein [archaeon]
MRFRGIFVFLFVLFFIELVLAGFVWNANGYYDVDEEDEGVQGIAFGGAYYEAIATNADIKSEGDKTIVNVKEGGMIEIKGIKYNIDSGKKNVFVFDKKGNLIEGTKFSVPKEGGEYRLDGFDVPLSGGTEVVYEKDKIVLKIPEGGEISEPKKVDEDAKGVFSYQADGEIKLNDEIIKGRGDGSEIYYDKNGFYILDNVNVMTENGKNDFLINSPEGKKTYLVFEEGKINDDLSSVFIGKDKVVLTNLNGKGGSVFFAEDNRLGIKTSSTNTVSAQVIYGKVIIDKAGEGDLGKLANVKISGESVVNLDHRIFYADNNELYFNAKGNSIKGFEHGDSDASIKLSLIDDDGKNINGFDVYSNGNDQYASVAPGQFESPLEFFKTSGDFYVSSSVAFNQLTPSSQDYYAGLGEAEQSKLLNYVGEGSGVKGVGESSALLQGTLNELIAEEIRRKQNPIKASVRIPSKGGSGTIIGVDKNDGRAIVVTCGHGSGSPKGSRHRVQLTDGSEIRGVSLGYAGTHLSGADMTIIKLDNPIKDLSYIPVASESHVADVGDPVLRIGCPGCGQFKQTQTTINRFSSGGSVGTRDSGGWGVQGGESGGGLFHEGRLIGIVSTGGGGQGWYTGTDDIRSFLTQNGYDYLINIIIFML